MTASKLILGTLLTATVLAAAETNIIEALRKARQAPPAVWGEVRVGSAARAPKEDDQARQVGQKLKKALPAAPAQVPAAPANQQQAIRLLRQNADPDLEVHLRPGNQTVMQLRGKLLQRQSLAKGSEQQRAEATAWAFLRQYREVLRLDDPDRELILHSHQSDATGERHLKFDQVYQRIPVWPSGFAVHLDAAGNVALVDGAYVPTPAGVNLEPLVTAAEAAERAKQAVVDGANATVTEPALIIYAPINIAPRLAWKLDVTANFLSSWRIVVDAQNGTILSRVTRVCEANVSGSAKDLAGAAQNLNVWSEAGKFYMADTSKRMYDNTGNPVSGPKGVISILDARNVTTKDLKTVFLIESPSATEWLPDGVSAMVNFGLTYDYFLERFDRNSLDGSAGNIQAVVRVAEMDNAFWNGNLKMMFFGTVRPYPLALDVVGHELTHGVTQNSADLVYELQPGALNESFSDILGEMVELRAVGSTTWKLGEALGKVFRDFKNPGSLQIGGLNRPYPSKMSEFLDLPNNDDNDHGGVHLNSSIINHCYYQLAEGLPGAIGVRDAERIFFRCLTTHLQKQSQFIDARLGCIASATALFGADSTQARKTIEAFDFVEILDRPPTPEPSPIPVVTGEDSSLLIAPDPFSGDLLLGRRENALGDPVDGILMADSVKLARPSISGDGSVAVYVSGTDDVCVVPTDNPFNGECLGLDGQIHSVALSPDGKFVAFVLNDLLRGEVDNRISVYEFATDQTRTYDLLAPVVDGAPVDNVLYADALIFSSDSKQLIYDAASQIHFGGGTALTRWTIFSINLATDSSSVLVPPLELADFGNPNMGRAGNRYLTFDALEAATGNGAIIALDLFTGEFGLVGTVGSGVGYPCFTGDESAIIYAQNDSSAFVSGFSLVRQQLTATRLATSGQPTLWYFDGSLGVIYRRGNFVGGNQNPSVSIASPAANAEFAVGAAIPITATASDADGSIANVEFYEGSDKLGEDNTAPYSFTWNNAPAGAHRIIALARDNLGAVSESAAVPITVGGTVTTSAKLVAAVNAGRIHLRLEASAGNYAIEESSDLRNWTERFPVTVSATGIVNVDDAATPGKRFFRSRKK